MGRDVPDHRRFISCESVAAFLRRPRRFFNTLDSPTYLYPFSAVRQSLRITGRIRPTRPMGRSIPARLRCVDEKSADLSDPRADHDTSANVKTDKNPVSPDAAARTPHPPEFSKIALLASPDGAHPLPLRFKWPGAPPYAFGHSRRPHIRPRQSSIASPANLIYSRIAAARSTSAAILPRFVFRPCFSTLETAPSIRITASV